MHVILDVQRASLPRNFGYEYWMYQGRIMFLDSVFLIVHMTAHLNGVLIQCLAYLACVCLDGVS